MKKKYWIINSNKKNNQYWIESIMIDQIQIIIKKNKDLYSETAIEAKQKLYKKIKKKYINQILKLINQNIKRRS